MELISLEFFLLILFTLVLYYSLPSKYSYIILGVSSLIFIFFNNLNIYSILYFLIILLTSYFGSKYISTSKKPKLFLILSITIILGILVYLKYTNLLINIINLLGFNLKYIEIKYSVIGISYFSLIMIGYLIDVYWKMNNPENNVIKLGLFMSYFPILTSGPFIKYSDVKDNLYQRKKFELSNIIDGLLRMMWGMFKVLVISNRLSIYVNSVYSNISSFNGFFVLLAVLIYPFILYTNFSGSIDIIMGVSNMLGIKLPENFDNPFAAKSITEFWRKWHITLGTFLKNYIFYPLLRTKFIQKLKSINKKMPTYVAMFILWTTIGIWHGGEYKFILASGLFQFIFILLEDILSKKIKLPNNKFFEIFKVLRTFILFSFSMIFFRAASIREGCEIVKELFQYNIVNDFSLIKMNVYDIFISIISLVMLLAYDNNHTELDKNISNKSTNTKVVYILIFTIIVMLFGIYGMGFNANDFIYSRF